MTHISHNRHTYSRLKYLLEETNDAFESCAGCVNSDYAAFLSMRLSELKNILKNPSLTGKQLRRVVRSGSKRFGKRDDEGQWAAFMAYYVERNANENHSKTTRYASGKILS
ncbi:MAG: hypothetical protein AAF204_00325 [Pseudomonadota bacterium]